MNSNFFYLNKNILKIKLNKIHLGKNESDNMS